MMWRFRLFMFMLTGAWMLAACGYTTATVRVAQNHALRRPEAPSGPFCCDCKLLRNNRASCSQWSTA